MTWVGGILLVLGFLAVVHVLGAVDRGKEVLQRNRAAFADLRNPDLDEDTKEKLVQQHAIRLFVLFLTLTAIAAAALALPAFVVWLGSKIGLWSFDAVMALTVTWQFLIIATVVAIAAMWAIKRWPGSTPEDAEFENRYTLSDRLLHKLVFKTTPAQIAFADIEEWMYANQLKSIKVDRPLLITALPRAGTTMLLNILAEQKEFAAHCYRDMPFILCPLLWSRLAERFRKNDQPRERAHGDGMTVSLDSPEAFEEMIWKAFWSDQYKSDRITTWPRCDDPDFVEFLLNHMRKIIHLRSRDSGQEDIRYISKNNDNVARLAAIPKTFESAIMLIPFRDPVQHAQSMLRQHQRFVEIHKHDRFASEYMAGVGHFDFGENLKPIDFDNWLAGEGQINTLDLSFWIRYWSAAYRHVLRHVGPRVRLICYDRLCQNPDEGVEQLCKLAEVQDHEALRVSAAVLKSPSRRDVDTSGIAQDVIDDAMRLFEQLNQAAGNQLPTTG